LNCPERVVGGDGADSMLWFGLKREGNRTKHYRKMKWRQRAHLSSIRRKCDTTCVGTWAGGEAASRRGKEGDDISWANTNLTGPKNKENRR
jgi:hypothetical protein